MIVVDASVAIKWAVKEPGHEAALAVLDIALLRSAPDLIFAEIANVLNKKIRSGDVSKQQAQVALLGVQQSIPMILPSKELAQFALSLAGELNHPAYDCFYLACAVGRGILVSADDKFVLKCRGSRYQTIVANLDDIGSGRLAALLSTIPTAASAPVKSH